MRLLITTGIGVTVKNIYLALMISLFLTTHCFAFGFGGGGGRVAQGAVRVLAQSAVPITVTGTTSEVVLASYELPAGLMGPNGAVRFRCIFSVTNNANSKTVRVKFGSQTVVGIAVTTNTAIGADKTISNRNAVNSQLIFQSGSAIETGVTGTAMISGSIDTSQNVNITFLGTPTNVTDMITLERYVIELLPGVN